MGLLSGAVTVLAAVRGYTALHVLLCMSGVAWSAQVDEGRAAAPPVWSLDGFEEQVLPRWVSTYSTGGAGTGRYSSSPHGVSADPIGSVGVLKTFYITRKLSGSFTPAELQSWADYISSHQHPDGYFKVPSGLGFSSRISSSTQSLAGLRLLNVSAPRYPLSWVVAVLNGTGTPADIARWTSFFEARVVHSAEGGAQDVGGLLLAATLFNRTAVYEPFFKWFFPWLEGLQDPSSGYWNVPAPAGGSWSPALHNTWHLLVPYLHLGRPFPRAKAILNTSLWLQSTSSGLSHP